MISITNETAHFRASPDKLRRATTSKKRRNAPKESDDAEALRLYEHAKVNHPDPYAWVGRQLGVGRSTAHNMANRAGKAQS